jgi:hypothetical protein
MSHEIVGCLENVEYNFTHTLTPKPTLISWDVRDSNP